MQLDFKRIFSRSIKKYFNSLIIGRIGKKNIAFSGALLIALVTIGIAIAASRHISTTFDEIIFMASGARGYNTGSFSLAPDQPPLAQYLYGLPIWLLRPQYPQEAREYDWRQSVNDEMPRYQYSQEFFWRSGNDPEQMALLGRMMSALFVGLLVLAVFFWARKIGGSLAGFIAASLVAFIPDVVAQGGIAYNDLPLALTFLIAVWALDTVMRKPTMVQGIIAGICVALALGVKFSALLLVPVAASLLALEWTKHRHDREWRHAIACAVILGLFTVYVCLVIIYKGDMALVEMRTGMSSTILHFARGHSTDIYLLGSRSLTGWWYFYPVAFLLKTSFAFHALLLIAFIGFMRSASKWSRFNSDSPLRALVVTVVVFFVVLITSKLQIGFRHALPLLPLLCIIIAIVITRLWSSITMLVRLVIIALLLWNAASTLSFYPYFLSYTSEYVQGRDHGDEVLLDSNFDWGQGLLALRQWMRSNHVDSIYLSYFGSALPSGYGIQYIPLRSVFDLALPITTTIHNPEYVVISATNLHGLYFRNENPFARFLSMKPVVVLAHTMFVYRLDGLDIQDLITVNVKNN